VRISDRDGQISGTQELPRSRRVSQAMSRMTLLALTALLIAAPAAHAVRKPVIGIGEQKAGMFSDTRWQRLELRHVRYIAPWDSLEDPRQRELLDDWMAAARDAGARVLLGFERSLRSRRLARTLPTARRFERQFVRLRARYPEVRDWIVWNEANHPFSLTANRPRRAARYFDAVARNCFGCNVVAADVLDVSGMSSWVARFKRHARMRPRLWGLHNYVDANRFTSTGTRALLEATGGGRVWFTETGGQVLRREYNKRGRVTREFRYPRRRAARSTLHAIRLARISSRIRRVYLYHWRAPFPVTNWDSALIGPRGETRPSYHVLRRYLRRTRR
jgi:hypothetical protein